jgi:transposase
LPKNFEGNREDTTSVEPPCGVWTRCDRRCPNASDRRSSSATRSSSRPRTWAPLEARGLRFCLVSNDRSLSRDELFAAYKRQHLVEGRFSDFKGPLSVRPVFLHSNRRIAALVGVISLALLLYGLIERTSPSAAVC